MEAPCVAALCRRHRRLHNAWGRRPHSLRRPRECLCQQGRPLQGDRCNVSRAWGPSRRRPRPLKSGKQGRQRSCGQRRPHRRSNSHNRSLRGHSRRRLSRRRRRSSSGSNNSISSIRSTSTSNSITSSSRLHSKAGRPMSTCTVQPVGALSVHKRLGARPPCPSRPSSHRRLSNLLRRACTLADKHIRRPTCSLVRSCTRRQGPRN
mmetsp:Transcript_19992/g.55280  ORF Transcript_19992/g.55280 Transcript_19992/m.55280 type:complete len:206 (+) Transcript_19992:751-1368(+)